MRTLTLSASLFGLLLLAATQPIQAQFANFGVAGAYGGVLYQGVAFANGAAGSFTNDNATITYAGPASATFANDGRFTARNGATDVFVGPGSSAGAQELSGSVAPLFYNLTLSNGATANFNVSNTAGLRLAGVLTFANAYTITPRTAATNAAGAVHFLPGASYTGITAGDDARFVDGYVMKIGTGSFIFPIGQAADQRSVELPGDGLPTAADSVAVAWLNGSAATTPDPSDANATHPLTALGTGILAVSDRGYWDWVRPTTAGSVPVRVSMPAQDPAFSTAAKLRLVGWDGARWVGLGTAGAADITEGQLLSGTVPPGITALAVGTAAAPLPVELLSFAVTRKGDDGLLSWRTASERNSAYFEVQQSNDGRTWAHVLGQVAAAGSSTTPLSYAYADPRLSRYGVPVVYYRLRQVDRDGTASFSPVASLLVEASTALALEVWPNPATTTTAAQLRISAPPAGPVEVAVYDAAGRVVFRQTVAPGAELALPCKGWSTGAYLVRARQGAHTATRRFVRE